ncbi:MAG TPA: S53 family peptidase [Thermoanaerobaculia bacterium]|nr:S53 family peptidase [Thermoanaerobaculia bacterium]
MAKSELRIPLPNARPRLLPRARRSIAAEMAVSPEKREEVTIVVRSRGPEAEWQALVHELSTTLPKTRRYLTRAEFKKQWGASPRDIAAVESFARLYRLKVVSADVFRRCVVVSGTQKQLERAFSVTFIPVRHLTGIYRAHRETPQVDEAVAGIVECVFGLDNLPAAETHLVAPPPDDAGTMDRSELLTAYSVPRAPFGARKRISGRGQCVAVIELGGGYYLSDYKRYFRQLGLEPPPLRVKRIGDAQNEPASPEAIQKYWDALQFGHFDPSKPITGSYRSDGQVAWTIETTMDLQLVGTIAPQATLLLVQSPNNDQGEYHALTSAIADARNDPSVISCSWGSAECRHTPAFMMAMDRWFQAAAVLGISVCYSSGDAGDGAIPMAQPPECKGLNFKICFPASSPHVLACGGTTLDPKEHKETAWKQVMAGATMAGGGGFSTMFDKPPWQGGIDADAWLPRGASSGRGRAIPDVAAKADFDHAFSVVVGGVEVASGGTSAAVPVWGGMMAVMNDGLKGRAGAIAPLFYNGLADGALRDITEGNTGYFHAEKGWDPCTGWGSPNGTALLRALSARPPRGRR